MAVAAGRVPAPGRLMPAPPPPHRRVPARGPRPRTVHDRRGRRRDAPRTPGVAAPGATSRRAAAPRASWAWRWARLRSRWSTRRWGADPAATSIPRRRPCSTASGASPARTSPATRSPRSSAGSPGSRPRGWRSRRGSPTPGALRRDLSRIVGRRAGLRRRSGHDVRPDVGRAARLESSALVALHRARRRRPRRALHHRRGAGVGHEPQPGPLLRPRARRAASSIASGSTSRRRRSACWRPPSSTSARRGLTPVFCAKLHHHSPARCIFHCRFDAPERPLAMSSEPLRRHHHRHRAPAAARSPTGWRRPACAS